MPATTIKTEFQILYYFLAFHCRKCIFWKKFRHWLYRLDPFFWCKNVIAYLYITVLHFACVSWRCKGRFRIKRKCQRNDENNFDLWWEERHFIMSFLFATKEVSLFLTWKSSPIIFSPIPFPCFCYLTSQQSLDLRGCVFQKPQKTMMSISAFRLYTFSVGTSCLIINKFVCVLTLCSIYNTWVGW